MTDFFISYAREDGAFAGALVERLEQHHWDAWIDQSDIPPSVLWMNEIQRAIDETMLVVAIASPHWLGSQACQIELELAENARVPIVHIQPDPASVDDAIEQILAAYRTLPPARAVALEAARSAAIWSAAGRRRSLLVRARPLSVMRKTLTAAPDQFSETAVAFVRASRRASVRRWLLGATVGLFAPSLVVVLGVAPRVADEVDARVTQSVERLTAYADRNTYAQWNIYSALERASTDADESFASYYQLFDFMTERTPSQWQGTPVEASGPVAVTSPDGSRVAAGEGSQVRITGTGADVRLPAAATVNAVAWSPDGEWIAVATVSGAEVISVGNAQAIALRGGTGTPLSLRWVDDRNVEVGTSTGVGVWSVFDGVEVARPVGVRYGASVGDNHYTVDAAGVVTATDTVTGATQEWDAAVPEGAMPTAMDDAGPLVAVAYGGDRPFLRVRDTSAGGDVVDIPLSDCSPTALSLAPSGADAYLVCAQAEINQTRVSLTDGTLTSQPMPEQYLYGVRALDDRVMWGGSYGAVFESGTDLSQRGRVPLSAGCGAPTRKFAGASDGHRLFPAGDGTGSASCAVRIDTSDGGVETHRLIFDASDGFAVPDAEVSADGSLVAYGLSDGRVRVFRTDDLSPVYFAQVMSDQVRDVFFSEDDNRLVVSGASGKTVAIPMPHVSQTDAGAALVEAARVRLQQAIDSGLYVSTVGGG